MEFEPLLIDDLKMLPFLMLGAVLLGLPAALPAQESDDESAPVIPEPLNFPRQISSDSGSVVVHVPQIDSWQDFAVVEGRFAIEVTPAGSDQTTLGVAEFRADTDPNLEQRVVAIENVEITVTSFPVEDDEERLELDGIVRGAAQQRTHFVPLDVVLSYIAPDASVPDTEGLSFDPPPIFYSDSPAILVMTDGEPLLAPIPDSRLQYVVNTNWDLFHYREREWYLRVDNRWIKADELSGEWQVDNSLPRDFGKLPEDDNWAEVRSAIPPTRSDEAVPTVLVSDRPSELIVTNGPPRFTEFAAPGLEYVTNTERDLFRYEQKIYYLVSGRWFISDTMYGPWEYVAELPEAFAAIPSDHDKGHVRAAIPNTDEARMAVLEASIPRKATVSRDAGDNVNAFFQGEPQFELIPSTSIERAVNSYNDILKVDDVFYMCDNAVWYVSGSSDGPWLVADSIPAVIYTIPPSSPSYHVTHVHVYDSDEDYVSTGYTSGYFGVHVSFGVAMYGSGYYYPSYYGYYPYGGYPYYPYYYPYPYSYGSAAWYNPNTGMYGRSASVYGPYGGYGRGASYNPQTGAYARGEAVWDSNEIAGRGIAYNPRTGTGVATNRYYNEDGGWGESLITHNDRWVETQSQWTGDSRQTRFETSEGLTGEIDRQRQGDTVVGSTNLQRGDQSLETGSLRNDQGSVVGARTGDGRQGFVGRNDEGDLYAGRDGQVYRRTDDGWQQNSGDGWSTVDVPDERAAQIDQARESFSTRRESVGEVAAPDWRSGAGNRSGTSNWSFADSYGTNNSNWSNRSFDSSRSPNTWDSSRRSELNRSRNARTSGYQNYGNRTGAAAGRLSQGQGVRGRRRN